MLDGRPLQMLRPSTGSLCSLHLRFSVCVIFSRLVVRYFSAPTLICVGDLSLFLTVWLLSSPFILRDFNIGFAKRYLFLCSSQFSRFFEWWDISCLCVLLFQRFFCSAYSESCDVYSVTLTNFSSYSHCFYYFLVSVSSVTFKWQNGLRVQLIFGRTRYDSKGRRTKLFSRTLFPLLSVHTCFICVLTFCCLPVKKSPAFFC